MSRARPCEARRVRLFVGLHLLAVGLIYLLAMLAGGGLGAAPWPPDLPGPSRAAVNAPARASAGQAVVEPSHAAAGDGPEWLMQRRVELPPRQSAELRARLPLTPP